MPSSGSRGSEKGINPPQYPTGAGCQGPFSKELVNLVNTVGRRGTGETPVPLSRSDAERRNEEMGWCGLL